MPTAPPLPSSPRVSSVLALRPGVTLQLRPIRPEDDWRLAEMVNAASDTARRQRFPNGPWGPVSAARFQALSRVDQRQHVAWVVTRGLGTEAAEDGGECLVAEGRYRIVPDSRDAEFALMVDEAWQGRGVGRWLLRALAAHAGQAGVRMLREELFADHTAALALLNRCRFQTAVHPHQLRVLHLSATPEQVSATLAERVQSVLGALAAKVGVRAPGWRHSAALRHRP